MNSFVLRINCNHLKPLINSSYLEIRHHLFCSVVTSLCLFKWSGAVVNHLEIEEMQYQSLYSELLKSYDLEYCISQLNLNASPYQFLEIHEIVEEFLHKKVSKTKRNFITTTIDGNYHLVIGVKQL